MHYLKKSFLKSLPGCMVLFLTSPQVQSAPDTRKPVRQYSVMIQSKISNVSFTFLLASGVNCEALNGPTDVIH